MDNDVVKHWARASLSIYSRTLSVADLERLVPFPPDRSKEKGTPIYQRTPLGRRPGSLQPHSVVTYESHVSRSEKMNAHLDDLLSRLEPAKDTLREFAQRARWEGFQSPTGRPLAPAALSLWVYSTEASSGVDITPDRLKAILDLGVNLSVALDADLEDDSEE
jgi:Domain of unknown function (DUF4279)